MSLLPPLRVAASMTIDPDGAMHDWIDLPEGWSLTPIPTQEIIHLVGVEGYQALLVDIAERERPAVMLTHPPYDYVTAAAAERIRATGTKLIAYAFDDDIFAMQQNSARDFAETIYDRYATTRQVRWATRPIPPAPRTDPPQHDIVLVGRAYPRRVALVETLRSLGFSVTTRGLDWPEGWIDRAGMIELYGAAKIVITTSDWEDCDVRMVKHRVLDTALLGAFQMIERSGDLAAYFAEDEVVSYGDVDELVSLLREWLPENWKCRAYAERARARVIAQHGWTLRWTQLTDGLALSAVKQPGYSALLDQSYTTLAARAEIDHRWYAAHALWTQLAQRQPNSSTAWAGIGRCLLATKRSREAIEPLLRSLQAPAITASYLSAQVSSHGVGTAMGHYGLWPPTAEAAALLIAAYQEAGDETGAVLFLEKITDPALRRRLATVLQAPGAGAPLLDAIAKLEQEAK